MKLREAEALAAKLGGSVEKVAARSWVVVIEDAPQKAKSSRVYAG
jgi:hypothetical protein